jgi:hypothetical protein
MQATKRDRRVENDLCMQRGYDNLNLVFIFISFYSRK